MKPISEIPNQNKEVVVAFLNILLANEYVLYTKTRNSHWNLDGPNYFELHVFLENQYIALDEMIDEIVEQIRSLGHFAMGSMKDFLSVAQMSEDNRNYSNSAHILENLLSDHETIIKSIQKGIFMISNELKDQETVVFVSGIMEQHQKMARLIKVFLAKPDFKSYKRSRIVNNMEAGLQA